MASEMDKEVAIDEFKEEKDVNTSNQKSLDCEQEEAELKLMVYDIKSRNLAFVHFLKFRDETMKELYLVTQEHDEIEKKCTKLTELEDKVTRDIKYHGTEIVDTPDLLIVDLEQLERLLGLISKKKFEMLDQVDLKKQKIIILEKELAAQDKRLLFLINMIEKNEVLSKLILELGTMLQEKSDSAKGSEIYIKKNDLLCEIADIKKKFIHNFSDVYFDSCLYSLLHNLIKDKIDEVIKEKYHYFEIIELFENEFIKLNSHIENFKIYVTTILDEYQLALETQNLLTAMLSDH